jgi:hypothetical protein
MLWNAFLPWMRFCRALVSGCPFDIFLLVGYELPYLLMHVFINTCVNQIRRNPINQFDLYSKGIK